MRKAVVNTGDNKLRRAGELMRLTPGPAQVKRAAHAVIMTPNAKEKIKWEDGKEYPLAKIETSSESHPFYTGTQKIMDTAGRVEKFRQKFGGKAAAKATGDGAVKTAEKRAAAAEAKKTDKPAAKKVATKKAK